MPSLLRVVWFAFALFQVFLVALPHWMIGPDTPPVEGLSKNFQFVIGLFGVLFFIWGLYAPKVLVQALKLPRPQAGEKFPPLLAALYLLRLASFEGCTMTGVLVSLFTANPNAGLVLFVLGFAGIWANYPRAEKLLQWI